MIKWFQNLRIAMKILLLAAIMLGFLTSLGLVGLRNIAQINQQLENMYKQDLHSVDHWGQIYAETVMISNHLLNHIVATDASTMYQAEKGIEVAQANIEACLADLKSLSLSDKEEELQELYEMAFTNWNKIRQPVLEQSKLGDAIGAQKHTKIAAEARDLTLALAVESQEYSRGQAEHRYEMSRETYQDTVRNFMLIMLGAGLLALGLSLGIGRLIGRPLKTLEGASRAIAGGNLAVTWSAASQDEVGMLSQALEHMVKQLGALIGTLNQNAVHVAAAAESLTMNTDNSKDILEEISASVAELAAGAHQQAMAAQDAAGQTGQIMQAMAANKERVAAIVASTEKVKELVANGLGAVEQQNVSVMENVGATANVAEAVENLAKEVAEIGAVLSTISQIAG